jgi:acetyl esterase/lipase
MPSISSKFLVDPELAPALDQFPPFNFSPETLPMMRAGLAEMAKATAGATVSGVDREVRHVPGPKGAPDVRIVIYTPKDAKAPRPALFHIHGGGYIMGAPEMSEPSNMALAKDIGCTLVSVDYRLAPETPHPGPVEDCYAALKWLFDNAKDLGVDATRIAVGGESAGGGLSAALALLARDRGEVKLAFQLLIYPMIDDRTVTHTDPHPYAGEYIWTPESNRFGWASLIGGEPGSKGVSPYAAAARAEDLRGLPPAFISVGALDLFLEEDMEYARRLARAGVPTELHIYPGAFHGFNMSAPSRVSTNFNRDSKEALRKALHG